MHEKAEYELYIGAYSPETIPLDRLGEYMRAFAKVLDSKGAVTFGGLGEGSTKLKAKVDWTESFEIDGRLTSQGLAEKPFPQAFSQLNELLKQDGTTGYISNSKRENVVLFPGVSEPKVATFPSFREGGTIRGQLVRIGGTDDTVHATLIEGDTSFRCSLRRELARDLARHLFGSTLRIYGTGRYERDTFGNWSIRQFDAEKFELVDDGSLSDAIVALRSLNVPGLRGIQSYNRLSELSEDGGSVQ